ncbi:MAG: polysaccharide biosynthesis tyrosine autokinase [Dysgonamonadaceae bacterium]|nr:polysaccharide biosynthesis tyrosine autokinase [Dysgonamonadaceae bacterium]
MDTQNISPVRIAADEKSVNLVDIFMYLLVHWKWFVFSLLIFGCYFGYKYSKTPFVYNRSVTIMVKTPANTQATMRLNRYNSFSAPVNVASEILQFKSKELMRRSIDNLHTDISYVVQNALRKNELYTKSPIRVSFLDTQPEDYYALSVIPFSNSEVELSISSGLKQTIKTIVPLNDTVSTFVGRLVIQPSVYYSTTWLGKTIKVTKYPRERMVSYFLSGFAAKQLQEDASILSISLTDNSAFRAADMLNMMVTVYNEEAIADKNRIAVNTAGFIHSRLEILEKQLGNVETDIEKMQKANEGLDISTVTQMYLSDNMAYKSAIKELDSQLSMVKLIKQYMLDENNVSDLIPDNTGLVEINIDNQITQYNNTVMRRNKLQEGSSDKNPVVEELNSSIRLMKQNILKSVDNTIYGLNMKRQNYDSQRNQVLSKIYSVPEKQREMLSVERQQKIKEELYLFLLNKQEENLLNQAMVDDNARVIDPASGSNAPVYPSKYKQLILGVSCGIVVPAIILLLMLMLDTRVHSKKEVENAVSAPFLGEIPFSPNVTKQQICVSAKGFDILTEAFRMLRTNLHYMIRSKEQKVISVISFQPDSGKTFTAINLAVSLVQTNRKGILMDLDLRKGTMSSYFKEKQGIGMANYLADQSLTPDDVIEKNAVCENLDLISIGAIAPNPTELLLSNRLDELIIELKKRYDFIMLDSAPIGLVADAFVVNRITDMNIFIVRAGKFDRRLLLELENLYIQKKWNNMGVVLNAVKKDRGYGYGYGYSYGYGYNYGYSYGEKNTKKTIIGKLFKTIR